MTNEEIEKLFPDLYTTLCDRSRGIKLLRDPLGFIYTHEEWEKIKRKLDLGHEQIQPKEIEEFNENLYRRKQPQQIPYVPIPHIEIPLHIRELKRKYKNPGWIYWLNSPGKNGTKIGKTAKWIKHRFRGIAQQLNSPINCIGAFNTIHFHSIEPLLHKHFDQQRITERGEWFDLSAEQIESIPKVIQMIQIEKGLL